MKAKHGGRRTVDASGSEDALWFESVLDAIDDLILVKGPRSRLLWANRAFRDRYALSNAELRSIIDGRQSDPDDTLQYVRDDLRVFVERTPIDVPSEPITDHRGETAFFHTIKCPIFRDGEVVAQVGVSRAIVHGATPVNRVIDVRTSRAARRRFSVDCRVWTDASEAIGGTIAVFHDVTDMLATEGRLREANEELAQFNYRVSHDIVAPIATARGYLDLAIEELGSGDAAEVPELLAETYRQLGRLDDLVRDLSDLARAGTEASRIETIDLRRLVDELVESRAGAKRIGASGDGLAIAVGLGFSELDSDPTRIRQMLANLIDNAAKFRDPAETVSYVRLDTRREGDTSVIEVSDNGIGIDPAFAERAFEMFTRGTSSVPGTGLGLYIIGKHADRLGGTVSIAHHAKPTVLRITLPTSPGAGG